jgi:hypothetical protein
MSVQIGILLAVACALATIDFLYKHRGAPRGCRRQLAASGRQRRQSVPFEVGSRLPCWSPRARGCCMSPPSRLRRALLLGTAAGVLFGVSDVAIKARTGAVADSGTVGLLSPWLVPRALASVIAFLRVRARAAEGPTPFQSSPSPASPPTSPRSRAAWSSSGTPRATRWASCSRPRAPARDCRRGAHARSSAGSQLPSRAPAFCEARSDAAVASVSAQSA